jgi:hypothetical protein
MQGITTEEYWSMAILITSRTANDDKAGKN